MKASSTLSVCYLWVITLVCLCLRLDSVTAYSSGAPTSSCSSMSPDHEGGSPSNDPCPFEIVTNLVSAQSSAASFQTEMISRVELCVFQEEMFSNESLVLTIQTKSSSSKLFKGYSYLNLKPNYF